MDKETKRILSLAAAWCGPLFVVSYTIFWGILGHNIPPPSMMGLTPEQLISEYYGKYQNDIAIGMIGCCAVAGFYIIFSMQLASMMRDEDGHIGLTGLLEVAGGILTSWSVIYCPAFWAACALFATSGVDPTVIKMMHVVTWIMYDCTFMVTTVQCAGVGLYTVLNKKQTIFPTWVGWCSLATGVIFVSCMLIPFAKEGPFAVSGLWNFYIVFGVWLLAFYLPYSYFVIKAVKNQKESVRPVAAHSI
ncbi:MAG: hypothetical protein WC073_05345 [Sterolibacterium sp.]